MNGYSFIFYIFRKQDTIDFYESFKFSNYFDYVFVIKSVTLLRMIGFLDFFWCNAPLLFTINSPALICSIAKHFFGIVHPLDIML